MSRLLIAAAVACFVTSLPAAAQWRKPEDAVKYRQSAMALQNNHLSRVFAMASGSGPFDAKSAAEQVEIIAMLNRLQFAAFIEGSEKVGNTKAKAEIWTEKDKFAAAVAKSQEDVLKLVAAARTGNQDQIKAAINTVGGSCKNCHDTYRQ